MEVRCAATVRLVMESRRAVSEEGSPCAGEDQHLLFPVGELLGGNLVRHQRDGGVEVEDAARRVRDSLTQLVETGRTSE